MQRRVFLAVMMVGAVGVTLFAAGCGDSSPRGTYDQFRRHYHAGNLNGMIALIAKTNQEQMAARGARLETEGADSAQKALNDELPPLETVKAELEKLIKEHSELGAVAELPLHEQLERAIVVVKSKNITDGLGKMNLRWVRLFVIPEAEIGKWINTPREGNSAARIEARFPTGEQQIMPLVLEDGNWKLAWPGR